MQADQPDDLLVRETMASLGPGAKDSTLDDLAAWIRQLEGLCVSKDAALAPASFRTDISGSCLSTFPASGTKLATTAQATTLQTKAVKGYAPLPELHMEKVSSKKKNARGEPKLRLSVERGPILVLLTITDLHGATRTLRAVTEDDNDLITIKHPGTTIEATVIPFAPDQLLERLRRVEAKLKPQREPMVQTSASSQQNVENASAPSPAGGVKYEIKRVGGQVIEKIVDWEKGTVTVKSSGCSHPTCNGTNCTAAPFTLTCKADGEVDYATDSPLMRAQLAQLAKNLQVNPSRHDDLCADTAAVLKEMRAIKENLHTARPGEKKRLTKELENMKAEFSKLAGVVQETPAGGWMRVSKEERLALLVKAKQKDPNRFPAVASRTLAALNEHIAIQEKYESTSNQTKKKRLYKLMGRKEIEYDGAMNDIAAIADGSVEDGLVSLGDWLRVPEEQLSVLLEKAQQKDAKRVAAIAGRTLAAFDECTAIKEKLEATSNQTKKKHLSRLLERKGVEFDEAMNEIVAIAVSHPNSQPKVVKDLHKLINFAIEHYRCMSS